MKYIDVRIRVSTSKVGLLIDMLPDWAQMVGYDKLKEVIENEPPPKPNGAYVPREGTAANAILTLLQKEPTTRVSIWRTLEKKFKPSALNSGLNTLRDKRIIGKVKDGRYAVS